MDQAGPNPPVVGVVGDSTCDQFVFNRFVYDSIVGMYVETDRLEGARRPGVAYDDLFEQLYVEFRWLSERLKTVVARNDARRAGGPPPELRGMYVTEEEVGGFLAWAASATDGPHDSIPATMLRVHPDERSAASAAAGTRLPLEEIGATFALSGEERQVLIATLAPAVHLEYEKVYAYSNDDVAKKRPTVALLLDLLSDDLRQKVRLRRLFYDSSPLVRYRLLASPDKSVPLLNRQVRIDDHVAERLLGSRDLDPVLATFVTEAAAEPEPMHGAEGIARVIGGVPAARICLVGRWRGEKRKLAQAACHTAGLNLLRVDTRGLVAAPASDALPVLAREASLMSSGLFLEDWTEALEGKDLELVASMHRLLGDFKAPVFFDESGPSLMAGIQLDLEVQVPAPSSKERAKHWREEGIVHGDGLDVAQLSLLRLDSAQIAAALRMARSYARYRGDSGLSHADLKTATRHQSQPQLASLAQRIQSGFTWRDIILPPDRMAQLRELAAQVEFQDFVYEEWGFGAKVQLGRGVAALFAGPSGTGKTMAAGIIGNELGLDMYRIDLSGLVSKYIGETEKNLGRVFDEAKDSNAVLFFDEADAVFGKRTEVRDSHDRYANIEVSYLLQKMEEYDGIVVMATNMRSNIDDAFLRRMKAVVEFPFPEEPDRLNIWRRMFEGTGKLDEDVDLTFMARRFRVAGGNIKNIALLAAFLAASEGREISMRHLVRATKREYQKLGRLVSEADFGPWYAEVGA